MGRPMAFRNDRSQGIHFVGRGHSCVSENVFFLFALLGVSPGRRVNIFGSLIFPRGCSFFWSLLLWQRMWKRLCIFTKKSGVLSLYFHQIDLRFVFVFSVSTRIQIFLSSPSSSFQMAEDRPINEQDRPLSIDVGLQNSEVIHMFPPLSPAFRRLIRKTARVFHYTDLMSVGHAPANHQISLTHGRLTASGGREHSAHGTSTERYCRTASAGRRVSAGACWCRDRHLLGPHRGPCAESGTAPSLPDPTGATACAPGGSGRDRRAEVHRREGRLT